ncbi:hypothetical protein NQ317_007667 [Molorchus minor]|uniref:GOLD domain-containing protein n=1 Tax=Molorchus minor TaxID=1323400 RepID=A0ABQ9J1C1_9CUCU|nr:hypothetical protein NQ317_007667 [Molorchus minor]
MELWCSCVFFFSYLVTANCIRWTLEPNTQKCLKEELHQKYTRLTEAPGQTVDYVVTDSNGHILSKRQDISKGRFTFNSERHDKYEICFISHVPPNLRGISQEVSLITKHDLDAKNYETLGEAAQLKPIEQELKKLEHLSNSIMEDFAYMRKKRRRNEGYKWNVQISIVLI